MVRASSGRASTTEKIAHNKPHEQQNGIDDPGAQRSEPLVPTTRGGMILRAPNECAPDQDRRQQAIVGPGQLPLPVQCSMGSTLRPAEGDTRGRTTDGWGNVTSMRSAPDRKTNRPRRQFPRGETLKSGARGGNPAEIHGGDPYARSKRLDPRRDTARQTAGRRASRFAGEGMRLEIITQKCGFVLIFPVGMQRTDHPAQR